MATPTNLPAAVSTGDVGTAAQFNNLRGAFRILQVVQASTTTVVSSASATPVDTTLTCSITPQSNTSKILFLVSQNIYSNAAGTGGIIKVLRDSTVLSTTIDICFGAASGSVQQYALNYMDSPATTSSLTYKTTISRNSGVGTIYTQVNANPATIVLLEVSA